MALRFGYNTNGFLCHRLDDALSILAELGYQGVGLTLDVHHLDPGRLPAGRLDQLRRLLEELALEVVIETGGRFVLDPRRKHQPTLVSRKAAGRARRLAFLRQAVDIAVELGAPAVSFWSGVSDGPADEEAFEQLAGGVTELLAYATDRNVRLAFEPEPGMLIETLSEFDQLRAAVGDELGLALDVGHVACAEALTIPQAVAHYGHLIEVVHIEDIKGGRHVHLPFGEGDLDFPPVLAAFEALGYNGLICVELSRDSHRAPTMAARALRFLRRASRT